MCTVPRKCALCLPLTQSGSRIIRTLMWENMQLSWRVIVLTSLHWEKVNSLGARIVRFWHATKRVYLFLWIDQPISQVWKSYKFHVQKIKEDSRDVPDPTLCIEKDDVMHQAYYKYAREDGHHPESYRVLKTLYERHIEGKHVPFQSYVITPEERGEIENDEKLPSYSRAFVQDARRSKCINMLNYNIRNPRSPCLF